MTDTGIAGYAMHSVLHPWCCHVGEREAKRSPVQKLVVDAVGQTVLSGSMKKYWVLQRILLPHDQAIHDSMKSETKAETEL
jgi:hypothetical protein